MREPEDLGVELISAYVDGEATDEERHQVEQWLSASDEHRRVFEEIRQMSDQIRSLPAQRLDDDFSRRVLQQIAERQAASAPAAAARPHDAGNVRSFVWAALALAAALLIGFFLRDSDPGNGRGPEIAINPPPTTVPLDSQVPSAPAPQIDPGMLTQIKTLQQQGKLILVFEVMVDQTGVENAAFANLLRRHGIHFTQTVPVPRDQQEKLLQKQFLKDAQIAEDDRKDLDRIDLYLVRCKAMQIETMWQDLLRRPEGIVGFYLNLSSLDANDQALQGVQRLVDSDLKSGEAAELLGQFAIFSRTARNVGSFGVIRSIDPELLQPALVPQAEPDGGLDSPDQIQAAQAAGDFDADVLFVVRQLRPLPAEDEG